MQMSDVAAHIRGAASHYVSDLALGRLAATARSTPGALFGAMRARRAFASLTVHPIAVRTPGSRPSLAIISNDRVISGHMAAAIAQIKALISKRDGLEGDELAVIHK